MRLAVTVFTFAVWGMLMTEPIETSAQPPAANRWPGYDRPSGKPQSRSVVLGGNGMAATSHPLAASVAIDMLKQGGSAADAAIAANAMLGVVEPMSCGIGGDLFVIYWDNKTQKLYGLNASGRSPKQLNRQVFASRSLQKIPIDGPLSWSTPGCVDGWQTLQQKFGRLTIDQVLKPAYQTAEAGFPVTEVIAGYWQGAQKQLRMYPESAATFLINGRAPEFGQMFKNPRLGATYRTIGREGAQAFYRGVIARKIVEFSQQNGGYFSLEDFSSHTSTWVEPVSTSYRGYDVWELPPNGQGIAALQILNLLEPYDLKQMGAGSTEYLHLLVEAKKLAFADRAKFYADPEFNKLPVNGLISKEYARNRGALIDRQQAASDVPAGDPQLEHGDTVYVTVVDKDRNCCSLIQSNYYGFGSKLTAADLGFVLQNRGALFSLAAKHRNTLEPGKRPFHTIIPAMVTRKGKPWFCFGVMGGDMQPQGHVQVLVNMIDFGMNVQAAGDAARVRHLGSATPTGSKAAGSGTVLVESGVAEDVVKQLRGMGHRVQRARGGFGGYQGILIAPENNVLHGATEPRKDGAAIGY